VISSHTPIARFTLASLVSIDTALTPTTLLFDHLFENTMKSVASSLALVALLPSLASAAIINSPPFLVQCQVSDPQH